jgi:hypothetical protein
VQPLQDRDVLRQVRSCRCSLSCPPRLPSRSGGAASSLLRSECQRAAWKSHKEVCKAPRRADPLDVGSMAAMLSSVSALDRPALAGSLDDFATQLQRHRARYVAFGKGVCTAARTLKLRVCALLCRSGDALPCVRRRVLVASGGRAGSRRAVPAVQPRRVD